MAYGQCKQQGICSTLPSNLRKNVILLNFIAGQTEISPLLDGNWKVKEVELSGSVLLEKMALGSRVAKSIYSPFIMRSLSLGGTGGRYLV